MRIGIDASNVGGGGGVTHLKEILNSFDWSYFNEEVKSITVFASQKVLDQLQSHESINKITFPDLNKGLISRVKFQLFQYDKEVRKHCDLLFAVTGDYLGSFKPLVGMSRNMLLYERNIWREIRQPKEVMRFYINFLKQKKCFKNASKIIFISEYAKRVVSEKLNLKEKNITTIHHGVSNKFSMPTSKQLPISNYSKDNPFKFLYISTIHTYKNQWNVIEAIGKLRKKEFPVECSFVGGSLFEPANKLVNSTKNKIDPKNEFIHLKGHVDYDIIEKEYESCDALIFASTCENMPNILLECMSSGKSIACSNKEPMPEFLKDGGFYFDAKDPDSIEKSLIELMEDEHRRSKYITENKLELEKYSWEKCSKETFKFLLENEK